MQTQNILINCFKHLKKVLTHKAWVFYYCCKIGMPFRGLMHDMSKFSPIEFFESVKYYQGNSSPINAAKADKGYSLAWQHHKGRNPHHYEYWIDKIDSGGIPIKMPYKYVKELICDYLAAGKAYHGKNFTYKDEQDWWYNKVTTCPPNMHPATFEFVGTVICGLASGHKFNRAFLDELKFILKY